MSSPRANYVCLLEADRDWATLLSHGSIVLFPPTDNDNIFQNFDHGPRDLSLS